MSRERSAAHTDGFSLPELLVVVAVIFVISAIAVPTTMQALNRYRLDGAVREVAGQIRSARLAAVTTNRPMRMRFNCPAASFYRGVEVTGNAAIDAAANRCSYPWPDPDPNAAPNADRAPMFLPDGITFGPSQDLNISPRGPITPVAGATPAIIEVRNGSEIRRITVSAAGRVQTP